MGLHLSGQWPGAGRCKELLMMCPLGVMSRGARNFWAGPVARPMLFFITRPFGLPCVSALATFCLFYTYLPQALAMHVWFFFFHTEMDTVFWGLPWCQKEVLWPSGLFPLPNPGVCFGEPSTKYLKDRILPVSKERGPLGFGLGRPKYTLPLLVPWGSRGFRDWGLSWRMDHLLYLCALFFFHGGLTKYHGIP